MPLFGGVHVETSKWNMTRTRGYALRTAKAVCYANAQSDRRVEYALFLDSITAMAFLGTPHNTDSKHFQDKCQLIVRSIAPTLVKQNLGRPSDNHVKAMKYPFKLFAEVSIHVNVLTVFELHESKVPNLFFNSWKQVVSGNPRQKFFLNLLVQHSLLPGS